MSQPQQGTYNDPATRGLPQQFRLSTPAFSDGGPIPERHALENENVSPRLTWSEPPAGTESLALICEDPDAPRGMFVHWLAWNLPSDWRDLPEGVARTMELSGGLRQGQNGFGDVGYGGPRPPRGSAPHRYVFHLYALDAPLELEPGAKRTDFDRAIEGHVLGEATLTGKYARP